MCKYFGKNRSGKCFFSGFGHYLGVDATWLRIIVVLSVVGFGFFKSHIPFNALLILYLILWAIVPGAKTYTQKCAMLGRDLGIKGAENSYIQDSSPSFLERVFRVAIGSLFIFIGLCMLVSVVAIVTLGGSDSSAFIDDFLITIYPSLKSWGLLSIVCGLLAYTIPSLFFLYEGIRILGRFKSPKWHPGLIMFIAWLIVIILLTVSLTKGFTNKYEELIESSRSLEKDTTIEVIVDTLSDNNFEDEIVVADQDSVAVY